MTEDFIYFIWKFRLFDQKQLQTVDGESVTVISPGIYNKDAGPDFTDVKIRIGNTLWAGSAEIHVRSSDWEKHRHNLDKAYNNVVLHVVFEHDMNVFRSDGTELHTLEIKNYISPTIESRYKKLMENISWIPCESQIGEIEPVHISNWLSRMLVERLEEKSENVIRLSEEFNGSWDDTFYILLARNFGFKINALPFEMLARSLPLQILTRHRNNPLQSEALLFGQAGFLQGTACDGYFEQLQAEYTFLRKKYALNPIEPFLWKFLRLRPQNFPVLRIAQFAALMQKGTGLFSKVLELEDPLKTRSLFSDLSVNPYWKTHSMPGRVTASRSCKPGKESVDNILMNTVAVILFSYGRFLGDQSLINRAVKLLESLPFEKNHITTRFTRIGIGKDDAAGSQALLQLKKTWCDKKKCLFCAVGAKIINSA